MDRHSPIHTHPGAHAHSPSPSATPRLPLSRNHTYLVPAIYNHSAPLTLTHTIIHNNAIHSPSYSLPQDPSHTPSHSRPVTPLTSIQSCLISLSPNHNTHWSQLTQSQSLTHIQSLSFINPQSLTLRHRAIFILSAIHTFIGTPQSYPVTQDSKLTSSHTQSHSYLVPHSPTHIWSHSVPLTLKESHFLLLALGHLLSHSPSLINRGTLLCMHSHRLNRITHTAFPHPTNKLS